MDESGIWVTNLGTIIHAAWQDALRKRFPDAIVATEVKVAWRSPQNPDVILTSGHLDATVSEEGWMTAIEVKTIGGVGFRQAVGAASGYRRKGSPLPTPK